MAPTLGRTDPSLAEILLRSPWDFDFFQAIRLLALLFPKKRPISGFREPLEESVRFRANPSISFAPSAIQELSPGTAADDPIEMTVNFMGLTGPMGILPVHYTEYLIARGYAGDRAAAAFFDLFNHRLISLFYLAWQKHHVPVLYEREAHQPHPLGGFTRYLLDLIGMGTAGLEGRLEGVADAVLLSYCGLIAQRPRSASGLEGLLRDYFQAPIQVEQFLGKWCRLEQDDWLSLGQDKASSQLGYGAIAGGQVWNPQARFRIRIGPLGWERFQNFLPGGAALAEAITLVRYFTNRATEFEVQCVLLAGEVPRYQLADDACSPRLGLSSWLKTVPFSNDAEDLVLAIRASGNVFEYPKKEGPPTDGTKL